MAIVASTRNVEFVCTLPNPPFKLGRVAAPGFYFGLLATGAQSVLIVLNTSGGLPCYACHTFLVPSD